MVSDWPGSPRHLGSAGSPTLPRSLYQGERIPAVLDRPWSPSHLGPVGSLPILMGFPYRPPESIAPLPSSTPLGAFGSDILVTSGHLRGSTPIVDITEHVPRVSAMIPDLRWRRSRIYGIERPLFAAKRIPSTRFSSHTKRLLRTEIACKKRWTLCIDRPPPLSLSFSFGTT